MPNINFRVSDGGNIKYVSYDENMLIEDFMKDYISKYCNYISLDLNYYTFKFCGKVLNLPKFKKKKLKEIIRSDGIVNFFKKQDTNYGGAWLAKNIYIKFLKFSNDFSEQICYSDLYGLLKLCLLSEISSKLDNDQLRKLPDIIYYIMKILKDGYIRTSDNIQKNIKEALEKMEGSNIINFSNYVDEVIDSNSISNILNFLNKNDLKEINDIKFRLSKYNNYIKLFDTEFEKSKKESIFEFSIISLVIIEREDFQNFKMKEKNVQIELKKYYIMELKLSLFPVF